MKENVSTLRLDMVPAMARTLSLKDEVVISDNLDSRVPEGIASRLKRRLPTRTLKPHGMKFPYRVAFHTILFVESGRVDCRINLKDYRIEGCAIFLAASGIVLDSLSYQAGTRFLIIAYSDAGGILPATIVLYQRVGRRDAEIFHLFCSRLTPDEWTGISNC